MSVVTSLPYSMAREAGTDANEQLTSTHQAMNSALANAKQQLQRHYATLEERRPPVPARPLAGREPRRILPTPPIVPIVSQPVPQVPPAPPPILPASLIPSPLTLHRPPIPPRPWDTPRRAVTPSTTIPAVSYTPALRPSASYVQLPSAPQPPIQSTSKQASPPPPEYNSPPFLEEFQTFQGTPSSSTYAPSLMGDFDVQFGAGVPGKSMPRPPRPALTFPRYGPPSTFAETSMGVMRDMNFPSNPANGMVPGSPTPPAYGQDHNPVSYVTAMEPAVVQLGDLPEGDTFLPPLGTFKKTKRPTAWRSGYSPRSGVLSIFPTLMRRRMSSGSKDDAPTLRSRKLTDSISWQGEPLEYDLRRPPLPVDSSQLAATPSASWMRLYHPGLPWYIEIQRTSARGITIFDILQQMHQQLMVPLTERAPVNQILLHNSWIHPASTFA